MIDISGATHAIPKAFEKASPPSTPGDEPCQPLYENPELRTRAGALRSDVSTPKRLEPRVFDSTHKTDLLRSETQWLISWSRTSQIEWKPVTLISTTAGTEAKAAAISLSLKQWGTRCGNT
ncbi:hypothetical protein NN561_011434 [Cricetulus griseus]